MRPFALILYPTMAPVSGGRSPLPALRSTGRERPTRSVAGAALRMRSAAAVAGALARVLFHVWLFWGQWQVGRLSDPLMAAKWAGSGLLLAALVVCHRRHASVFHGRRALVIWTLAAVVHVGAGQPAHSGAPESSSAVLFVLPGMAGAALLAAAGLLLAARRSRASAPRTLRPLVRAARASFPPSFLFAGPLGLRAPPVRFA